MPKESRSLKLAASLEAQIDGLKGTYLGDSRSEVITFILRDWFLNNQERIAVVKGSGLTSNPPPQTAAKE